MTTEIANTIFKQLGGGRFVAMTGAKNLIAHKDGLSFKIGYNSPGINYVKITLNGNDLYNMSFERRSVRKGELKVKVISSLEDIYFDQLQEFFTDQTGLYTSLR